ncbi:MULTISPECIES: hypothetical protein [Nostocales]|uniref:Uncharacterized protein n=3 Tax=Nostocales TaxID=1161 RepID=A0A0C1R4N7_9CYAN|nr:hypothetical protein [Tolypothrix bouteillei]KAF3889241.1 hypothetical protein DA73_0400029985 [Tolypothrix bouteillei VB521301]
MVKLIYLIPTAMVALSVGVAIAPAEANCGNEIVKLGLVQPTIECYWQQLQQQTNFSWGKANPYGTLSGDRKEEPTQR